MIGITRPTTPRRQEKETNKADDDFTLSIKPVERTIPTRNHPLTTSGSGQQNPVAPNNMENYESSSIADTASTARCEKAVGNLQHRESSAARITSVLLLSTATFP